MILDLLEREERKIKEMKHKRFDIKTISTFNNDIFTLNNHSIVIQYNDIFTPNNHSIFIRNSR